MSLVELNVGMSFFEQSIYAIEEFIAVRAKIGAWKQDKYMLALTASNPESNCMVEEEADNTILDGEDDFDDHKMGIRGQSGGYSGGQNDYLNNMDELYGGKRQHGQDVHSTKILSSLQHPYKHFKAQL